MTERERLSLTIQVLAVGVLLFMALGWVFSLGYHPGEGDVLIRITTRVSGVLVIGLPVILTLGLITVTIRCLFRKSK